MSHGFFCAAALACVVPRHWWLRCASCHGIGDCFSPRWLLCFALCHCVPTFWSVATPRTFPDVPFFLQKVAQAMPNFGCSFFYTSRCHFPEHPFWMFLYFIFWHIKMPLSGAPQHPQLSGSSLCFSGKQSSRRTISGSPLLFYHIAMPLSKTPQLFP